MVFAGLGAPKQEGGREDETDNKWMSGVQHRMQCRASNSLARRIERWSPISCVCPPARRTGSTELMKKEMKGNTTHKKLERPSKNLKCTVPGCRAQAIQIQDLVKSRMPEIVEPKQFIQSRVLVKRTRFTVKRRAAQLLHPEGVTGFSWRLQLLPVCDSWCHLCSTQSGLRDVHDLHLCMRCVRRPAADPCPRGWRGPMGCGGRCVRHELKRVRNVSWFHCRWMNLLAWHVVGACLCFVVFVCLACRFAVCFVVLCCFFVL